MNIVGLVIGIVSFMCIGVFHPIVIKAEYHFGKRCWWFFMILGVASCVVSLFIENMLSSTLLAVFAFSCFWSIFELFEQEERVRKGWFPRNPRRRYPFDNQ